MSWGDFTVPILPKGYRFQPSDEELLSELEQKCKDSQITTIIPEIDMYKYEPRQLPELAFKGAENLGRKFFFFFFSWFMSEATWDSQREWYFFVRRDYKSINSSRSNRTTVGGYWNTTGRGSAIKAPGSKAVIGRKKTLTFHKSGVPKPQGRTGWVMHEYYLIQEHCDDPKQIGEFVVCCLKYKSDDSVHDEEAPLYNRGNSSCGMASNVENQTEENWVSQEQVDVVPPPSGNDYEAETSGSCSVATSVVNEAEENWVSQELGNVVPIPNGNEAETVGGIITEEEEEYLGDAVQVPIGNLQGFKGTEQNDHSTSVEGRPDRSNSSNMFEGLLDDQGNLYSLFHSPAPPHLDQLYQSPMNTANVHIEDCRKRAYPFEHDHPTPLKKNNVSTNDDDKQVSNSTPNYENRAANMIPEGHSHPGENLGSDSDSFLPKDYEYTQPSINGGPRDFSNYNDFIELDDLLSFCKGIDSSLAEFSDTIIDEGRGVTSDRNTLGGHGSENDYSALAFGASLHRS